MTATQSNKLAMYIAVRVFLTDFLNSTTATSLFPALTAKQATLITLLDKLLSHVGTQHEPLSGRIQVRDFAQEKAIRSAKGVAGALLSYAITHELLDLAEQARTSVSAF